MRNAFLNTLSNIMQENENIVVITADMGFSVFEGLQRKFPKRFFNTGVTEQSSIGVAVGLAMSDYRVFFYAQAPFATMRCMEQVRLDVAYNKVNVKIVGVAAGFSLNQLGVSHFALEDVGLMRLLPNMTIFTPGDPYEAAWATRQAYEIDGPAYIRITTGNSPLIHKDKLSIKVGRGLKIIEGKDLTILVSGSLLPLGKEIVRSLKKKKIEASLISFPTFKPIDKELILKEAKNTGRIFTLEEHSVIGGLGSSVAEILAESNINPKFFRFGAPDKFTDITGSQIFLLDYNGLSKDSIVSSILSFITVS